MLGLIVNADKSESVEDRLLNTEGDQDRTDFWGNSALHLAAGNNHLNCVSFLVHFGANLWIVDNDGQTALDVAALKSHQDVVRFLDAKMGVQATVDKKGVDKKRVKAQQEAEKRVKKLNKLDKQQNKNINKEMDVPLQPPNSQTPLQSGTQRSAPALLVGGGTQKTSLEQKLKQTLRLGRSSRSAGASAGAIMNKTFSEHVLNGQPKTAKGTLSASQGRLYVNNHKEDIYAQPNKSTSTEVIYANPTEETGADSGINMDMVPEPPSLFDRPGFGSVAFRNTKISGTFLSMQKGPNRRDHNHDSGNEPEDDFAWDEDEEIGLNDCSEMGPLETFLTAHNLMDLYRIFREEEITLDSLMLINEQDLQDLEIPLGPRKLLMDAINRRKGVMHSPGAIVDVRM